MERELDACARVVEFDPLGQRQTARGYQVFNQPGPLKQFLRQRLRASFKILYQPTSGEIEHHFEAVTRLVIACGELIYGIDEVDMVCNASYSSPGLKHLVNYGRHCRVGMITTSRRPAQVSREFTSQCAELRIFRTTEPRDISYFQGVIGSYAAQLPKLGEYQYLQWRDDAGFEPRILGGKKS